jgi:hypothetical protein
MGISIRDFLRGSVVLASGLVLGMGCAFIDAVQGDEETDPVECTGTMDDCNLEAADGCETNLATNVLHCGLCNNECDLSNAVESCEDSACAILSCDANFIDSDGEVDNGCETAVMS